MSGIVGVVQFDGSPVESGLLRKLTNFLAFRGPDNQQTWIKDNVGFGHVLFKTTEESERDSQPLTLDGKAWIVADARIDAREDLLAAFNTAGEQGIEPSSWTDAELILRAYRVWGTDCVQHLLGDFAFGIWDDARQKLFCARDHMGVKPFYYAQIGSCVIFSNTLDCIRQYPLISDKLNDLAIADFLLFGFNQDAATTSFADIRRIPPAHCAIWSRDGLSLRRYWSMPMDEPIFYKRADDYTDQFHNLLRKCVADRLRTHQVWIFMSGGIDSPTLAAAARNLLRERYTTFELMALTDVSPVLRDEPHYAGMIAKHLAIPIHYRRWPDSEETDWEHAPFSLPEPCPDAFLTLSERRFWNSLASYSRVFFYGEGPDNALMLDWKPHFASLMKNGRYGLLLRNLLSTVLSERRPPFWGGFLKRMELGHDGADQKDAGFPEWLDPKFEARLKLRERWGIFSSPATCLHPFRPKSYASLQTPLWQFLFERFDPGVTNAFSEVRHPFVDIRILRFMLAVPPLPWCRSKYLMRKAMDGSLPSKILHRRKTPLNHRLLSTYLAKFCRLQFLPSDAIRDYVDSELIPKFQAPADIGQSLRIRCLNHWLQNSHRSSHNLQQGIPSGRSAEQAARIA
jgi:asparagine synthase (glutamine-hydrolysing)